MTDYNLFMKRNCTLKNIFFDIIHNYYAQLFYSCGHGCEFFPPLVSSEDLIYSQIFLIIEKVIQNQFTTMFSL